MPESAGLSVAESGNLPRMRGAVVPVGRDWVDDKGGIVTTDRPDTIVLIHGFWVTPRSWEHWIDHYERKGFRVLAPAYPGFEVEVEALNADPTPIEEVTVPAIIEHLASVIRPIDPPLSSLDTPRAVCSCRSCWTTGTARSALRSTRRRPRVSPWSRSLR